MIAPSKKLVHARHDYLKPFLLRAREQHPGTVNFPGKTSVEGEYTNTFVKARVSSGGGDETPPP